MLELKFRLGLFTRPLLREGSCLQLDILFVCLFVRTIASTFPIIRESCQAPHIKGWHQWWQWHTNKRTNCLNHQNHMIRQNHQIYQNHQIKIISRVYYRSTRKFYCKSLSIIWGGHSPLQCYTAKQAFWCLRFCTNILLTVQFQQGQL